MLQDVIEALRRNAPDSLALARAEVEAAPDHADAHHVLALAQRAAGQRADAHGSVDRAHALAPENPVFLLTRAGLFLDEGDLAGAQREIDAAVVLDPNQLAAYVMAAQIALARGDVDAAERQARRAGLVNPQHPHVHMILGQIEMQRGRLDEAIGLLSAAVAAAPEDTLALSSLGQAYLAHGSAAFAEQAFRRALERDPRQPGLSFGLIESLRRQGRGPEAAGVLEGLRRDAPDDLMVQQVHGELALADEAYDDALRAFRGVLEKRPGHPRALAGAMRIWIKEGQQQHGRDVLDTLLKANPATPSLWQARLALEEGRREPSREVVERWLEAMPENPDVLEAAAQVQEAEGHFVEAGELADRALKATPALHVGAELVKARVQLHSDPQAARRRLEYLAKATRDPRQLRAIAGWLGYAADVCGDYARALAIWQDAHGLEQGLAPLPPMGDIDEELDRAATSASEARNDVVEPPAIFLWGPPGSGVERIAAILRGQTSLPFLNDRMHNTRRRDGFQTGDFSHLINRDREAEAAEAFNFYWRHGIAELGYGDTSVIDWLRRWDARLVPAIRRAMPRSVLIAAIRDPRDMLVNWIAYGSPLGFAYPGALRAAKWLAMALEHLGWLSNHPLIDLCLLQIDAIDDDAPAMAQQMQRFLRLEQPPSTDLSDRLRHAQGGHPSRLPAGHWRHYRDILAEPFAVLENISQRLGYPVD